MTLAYPEFLALLSDPAVIQRNWIHKATSRRAHIDCVNFGRDWFIGAPWPILVRLHYFDNGFGSISARRLYEEWTIVPLSTPAGAISLDRAREDAAARLSVDLRGLL